MAKKLMKMQVKKQSEITLRQLYEQHILYCKSQNLSPVTIKNYVQGFRLLTQYLEDDMLVSDVNNGLIRDYIYSIQQEDVKPSTINNRIRYLKLLMNYAWEQEYIPNRLIIKPVKEIQENKTPLTKHECELLLKRPKMDDFCEYRNWVIVNVLLATGIRSKNILEMKVSDVDLKERTIILRDTKNKKGQTIYLSQSITKILLEYFKLTGVDEYVFPTHTNEPMTRWALRMGFNKYVERRGVPRAHPHLLRHTYARDLVKANVNPVIIKELLGHHSLEVTQRYIKLFSDEIQQATEGLDTLAQYQKQRIKLGGSK